MRRSLRTGIAVVAAAGVIMFLGGSSLPKAAAVVRPHEFAPSFVIPANTDVNPQLTDAQLVAAAAPERAALAAQARAEAAAAAAAAAHAAAVARSGSRSYSGGSGGSTINVWTAGFQAQVNACRGGVDLTGAYGTRTVGEHWSCGGSSFPEAPGSVVQFTGLDAGTYKVIGLVATLNAYVANSSSIPRGYQMLFQTCRGGDSHYTIFIALARIG